MKMKTLNVIVAAACCTLLALSCQSNPQQSTTSTLLTTPGNPFLPLWEHIPDGEPYVFEDPDNPGKQRVYIYGSHDDLVSAYCGRDQVVWSAPVEDLTQWRYDGVIPLWIRTATASPSTLPVPPMCSMPLMSPS